MPLNTFAKVTSNASRWRSSLTSTARDEPIEVLDRLVRHLAIERAEKVEKFARRDRYVRLAQFGEKLRNMRYASVAQSPRAIGAFAILENSALERRVAGVIEREIFEPAARAGGRTSEIFAIGDIHGRPDLLEALHRRAADGQRGALSGANSSCSATSSIAGPTRLARSAWR